ncbi:MAG TPA: hypothetical protein DIW43_03205 [Spongiibacteraceae bacterium]|nr:hypothetical protein [Spongiibacteraceae bacterium]HCS26432.1 hypothetical protein [Spongiibacteraceae bacterium]
MTTYAKITPHSAIREILPDVFFVQGSYRFAIGFRFSRNMLVLRQGRELTVINPVRLNETEEQKLDALGTVRHVMRLGTFHGMDDPYYVDRYQATFWCQPGKGQYSVPAIDQELGALAQLPIEGLSCLPFTATKEPECVLHLARDGGLLISCDSLQDWSDYGQCTWLSKRVLPRMGFEKRLLVGPIWKKLFSTDNAMLKQDFDKILALGCKHFVGAHGGYRLHDAGEHLEAAVTKAFAA